MAEGAGQELRFSGVAASRGVAIGPVRKLSGVQVKADERKIAPHETTGEKARFAGAVAACAAHVSAQAEAAGVPGETRDILRSHLAILRDPYLEQLVNGHIEGLENAEMALVMAVEEIAAQFMLLDDELIKARVDDFEEESVRLLRCMQGREIGEDPLFWQGQPCILVAEDLPPSTATLLDPKSVLGFATDDGGVTSHTAIVARALEIPAVVGAAALFAAAQDGDECIVDGLSGEVVLNPAPETLAAAKAARQDLEQKRARLQALKTMPAKTTDGVVVRLLANIGSLRECPVALEYGAEGVGLFRTEFIYLESRRFPTEEYQYAIYRSVAKQMAERPVVVRTLDIGGDKQLPYYTFPKEDNPYLGCRAIRFCLRNPEIFKTQLRAILRASAHGNVRIMLPMVVSLQEVEESRALLAECMGELAAEGRAFNPDIPLGIMMETPASVVMADVFAQNVDFFSIGTNDLAQYLLAADRDNEHLQGLYSSYHPVVLRSIAQVVDAAAKQGIPVELCGVMGSDPMAAPLLVGLGLRGLSMNPSAIPLMKQNIRFYACEDTGQLAKAALAASDTHEVKDIVKAFTGGIQP